jgi:hypothetical protein
VNLSAAADGAIDAGVATLLPGSLATSGDIEPDMLR